MKEKFMEIYGKELRAIYDKYDMDKSVCMNILIAWCRNLNNPNKQYVYDFEGSDEVNLYELELDIKNLEDNFEIPRLEDGMWKI